MNREADRLTEAREQSVPWRKWGPYLSDRQWGTVREDYSADGNAWNYFTHDQARSRAYRWGEDGIGGISDEMQVLCFSLGLWNGADPILKERLFGLTNNEGNHGEDVKEYYFYVDCTPTHSYMKFVYKYPHAAYPYGRIIDENRRRGRLDPEFELIDSGVFDENRYFDVFVEYAKETPEDILIKITVENRGPEEATLHLLPTLWFRNTWSWKGGAPKPLLEQGAAPKGSVAIAASHPDLGVRTLYCEGSPQLLFTENETNNERVFGGQNASPYVKDGLDEYVVHGRTERVNPANHGTKAAPYYKLTVPAGGSRVVRLRLTQAAPEGKSASRVFDKPFEQTFAARKGEADEFYSSITPDTVSADAALVMRQALAGMLWSKQFYNLEIDRWMSDRPAGMSATRNQDWAHLSNAHIVSMPDKWEYPWYAAWDLAFHCVAIAMVDPDFSKQQLDLMLEEEYLHPNGQMPAYEWNFGDVNPPVHAWAARMVFQMSKGDRGGADLKFLEEVFQKLTLNFSWWVNRKDPNGKNVFGGGFLGLDNIGIFDRSSPLPTGGHLEQADGTAWMAFYCQCMLQIAIELALENPVYEPMVTRFLQHFIRIAAAMEGLGDGRVSMWDEEDGFFYDVLQLPDGTATRLKVRSLVGLLPLCAATVLHGKIRTHMPAVVEKMRAFMLRHPGLASAACLESALNLGVGGRSLLQLMDEKKLRRVLSKMLDESEFLGRYGIRSISRYHLDHPYVFYAGGQEFKVQYVPAESDTGMFGGNSNWRGPVWMPTNILLVRSLLNLYSYYGDEFQVECPTGSGHLMNLFEVAQEISNRLIRTFLRNEDGRRPVYGGTEKFQSDPHWRDYILFYEFFHGDNGAGIGASHQTGWTGTVATLIQMFGHLTGAQLLAGTAGIAFDKSKVSPSAKTVS